MKSRIMNKKREKILIYGFNKEISDLFAKTAEELKTELVVLDRHCASERIGFLAGEEGYLQSGEKSEAEGECVIFSGIDGKTLDRTLSVMRKNGLGNIPLKAVVTPHNMSMTLGQLMTELKKEHFAMHGNEGGEQNV